MAASGCGPPDSAIGSEDLLTAFRVRADTTAGLNADTGWAGAVNENVTVTADVPFRLRLEVEGSASGEARRFGLQYRRNDGVWTDVEVSDFPYPEAVTPRVSIVSTRAYENGDETTDLLSGSASDYLAGAGVELDTLTPPWSGADRQGEWEWPLVIRRFADGAVTNEQDDTFAFRLIDEGGAPLRSNAGPVLTLSVPPGHLGGTFVETPGRIGPWRTSDGSLYFIMEPTETDNVLMMVKSTDGGATWREVDGDNRPMADDLEGLASAPAGGTIHILHQTSDHVWHHAFHTVDHVASPDTWGVRDELVAEPPEPPTQVASIAVRTDGHIVGVYGGDEKIRFKIRSPGGSWGDETIVDAGEGPNLSGPQAALGASDVVHLAYTGADGTAWYRRIRPDGSLSAREQIATGLGTSEYDVGSVLPLVFMRETNTVVILYRLATGRLWARRVVNHGAPTAPAEVSARQVVQSPVDSDQTGADAVAFGQSVHVLFIEEGSGSIYHVRSDAGGEWQQETREVDGVRAQWIRGTVFPRADGTPVYGYVFDAGSNGGSGMNTYAELPLEGR